MGEVGVAGFVEVGEGADVGFLFCEGLVWFRRGGGGGDRGVPCSSIMEGVSSSEEMSSSG